MPQPAATVPAGVPVLVPPSEAVPEHIVGVDQMYARLHRCAPPSPSGSFGGWLGVGFHYAGDALTLEPDASELWLRSSREAPDPASAAIQVTDVSLVQGRAAATQAAQAAGRWEFTRESAEHSDGVALPYAPHGKHVRLIALTESVHVMMPLKATLPHHAQQHQPQQHAAGAAHAPTPAGVVPATPEARMVEGVHEGASWWWGTATFVGDSVIRREVAAAAAAVMAGQGGLQPDAGAAVRVAEHGTRALSHAHALVHQQRAAAGAPLGPSPGGHVAAASGLRARLDEPCRLSVGVAYGGGAHGGGGPQALALARGLCVWEPLRVNVAPEPGLDLQGLLKGEAAGPALSPHDTCAWLQPLLERAAAATAELGGGCRLLAEGGVTVRATQVRLVPGTECLAERSASGKLVVGAQWARADPDTAAAIAGAGVRPEDIEAPDLSDLWHGSPLHVAVPTGYHLSTFPDGGYLICPHHFAAALQPEPPHAVQPGPIAAGGSGTERVQWAVEWGVMGFGGRWARVRVFLRPSGWVERWEVVELFAH